MRAAILALALLAGCITQGRAQEPAQTNVVVLADSVRARLARDWDKQAKNVLQKERAYCVTYRAGPIEGGRLFLITAITAAETDRATSDHIAFYCDAAPGRAALHVHPPTTCETETKCHFGGPEAYECFASPLDAEELSKSTDEFGLIQCDRHAIIAFWPGLRPQK